MADRTQIEWTDATWNPITGCTVVSPGCTNCYAMRLAGTRLKHTPSRAGLTMDSKAGPVWNGKVRFNSEWLTQPLRWKKPRMIFVCAHGDLFHEDVPDEWIDQVFAIMAEAHWHTFQVLTKRTKRMRQYLAVREHQLAAALMALFNQRVPSPGRWPRLPLPNVWLGVSVEDQTRADQRLATMAALAEMGWLTWVSYEPALGPVNWKGWEFARWIVSGGESGGSARPTHPEWHRATRDFCAAREIAFLFKQWGSWAPRRPSKKSDLVDARMSLILSPSGSITSGLLNYPDDAWVVDRIGKTRAGRLLDGREHNGMPQPREVPAL